MGLGAKEEIKKNTAFIFIPNTCIISVERVRRSAEIQPVLLAHP